MLRIVFPEQLKYNRLIISQRFITGDTAGFFFFFLLSFFWIDRACDTIPKSEREKGVLPVIIVSQNKTLRFGKERLQTPSPSLQASPPGHWSQLARLCSEQRPSAVPSC